MKKILKITAILSICSMFLLVACDDSDNFQSRFKYPKGNGYGYITDTTFYYYTSFTDGSSDTTFYKCKSDEMNQAMKKVWFGHIYSGLNWQAQKEYHEELSKIEVNPIRKGN